MEIYLDIAGASDYSVFIKSNQNRENKMEITEFDKDWEDAIRTPDLNNIKSEGITIRTGNQVLKLTVTDMVSLPEDDIKEELEKKYFEAITSLKTQFDIYKEQMSFAIDKKKAEYEEKEKQLRTQLNKTNSLPNIKEEHCNQGLGVVNSDDGGLVWVYNCVYQPKYINKKIIDPSFAKRLMTPVTIKIYTNSEDCVVNMRLVKIIGHSKFQHYHSLSGSSDCWGEFSYSGKKIDSPEDAIKLAKDALVVLETINEFSIGKRNPKGLSRFDTLMKHILDEERTDQPAKKSSVNSRNSRTGFDETTNDTNSENIWST